MGNKKTMVICHDWLPLFQSMEPADVCAILFALMDFDISGEVPQIEFENKLLDSVYRHMLAFTVERHEMYMDKCEQNARNARKRYERPHATACERKRTHADTDTDNDTDNDTDTDIDIDKPTLADIKTFISKEGLKAVNADSFWNYYESMHWLLDGRPMDWKARARWWNSNGAKVGGFNDFNQRANDWHKLEKELLKK